MMRDDDLDQLERTSEAFWSELERGGFGQPSPGQWTAEQIAAHLILTDMGLVEVNDLLVSGEPASYENLDSQAPARLAEAITDAGGTLAGLAASGRAQAARTRESFNALPDGLARADVPVAIHHEGALLFSEPRVWWEFAVQGIHRFHTPTHLRQLTELRRPSVDLQ